MKKYIFIFIFLLFSHQAFAGLPGSYRVGITQICSGGLTGNFTYDLTLSKDKIFTALGYGSYIGPYTTFKIDCGGTWSRNQRQVALDTTTCAVTDLAIYNSSATPEPSPRVLTTYLNNSLEAILHFPPNNNSTFLVHNDQSEQEELIIDGVTTFRACTKQGMGVRLKGNNATILPALEGPIDP